MTKMVSLKEDVIKQAMICIKVEDCEWAPVYFTQESPGVKLLDCEREISLLKEEESVGIKEEDHQQVSIYDGMQNCETTNIFKQDLSSENDSSLWGLPVFQTDSAKGKQNSPKPHSVQEKSESPELENKVMEEMCDRREEKEQPSMVQSGISDFPETGSFSSPSFAQTSLWFNSEQNNCNENTKKKVWRSDSLPSLQYSSLQIGQIATMDDIGSHPQIQNTNLLALLVCQECGKSFTCRFDFKDHQRLHKGKQPHGCIECGKQFTQLGNLKAHMRIHTGEKPHCCKACGKRFSQLSHLQAHTRVHTGEKPHGCAECGKRFSQHSHLKAHSRSHTGEKPHCCSECGKHFSQRRDLQTHTRVHTGEKPHCCAECGKLFSTIGNLARHKRIHAREKLLHSLQRCTDSCGRESLFTLTSG
ncbi:zinc finger protein 45-like isoform X2 [Erpetoichthys calabaricus]|uniref:zinc finger protein 45-like isoform X1 n=1 Tax=Erpetoichthys calabaricus TaxID=27687 RepID=UPI002234C653|nr:zinc finger protein 45-like isoform X1 [Erpetoichthys calabaricus]XP_051783529.1 zinc finger protein 45-like isoform X1 [Erpetoichthys calabaricus]XP_051783530.1 zinc finger protein 45-like isoform X1 [Erpetoichthys calabaricus]XP_051783531.1 zinc finger protein 45-like isoform X2 [Erpetoichthys calabaricus]XP_051783532.1 zinc finger protein 45-like isoform X2 [Erpetoichthys calabaricus]